MDSATISIRICCIKFVQKVVQVETPGMIADPRVSSIGRQHGLTQDTDNEQRAESNETSIALVPRNHPLLSLPNLEAEASGLLDRLLSVFHDNTMCVACRTLRAMLMSAGIPL